MVNTDQLSVQREKSRKSEETPDQSLRGAAADHHKKNGTSQPAHIDMLVHGSGDQFLI